jgi:type VI secretion system protein ImpF
VASRPGARETILPSVLDRLLDDEPDQRQERPKPTAQLVRDLRDAVIRDVSALLNARRAWPPPPPELDELRQSVVDFGIPDFTGADLSSADAREAFRREVEDTIRRYEPRFKTVHVELIRGDDASDRTLRLRIDALVHADPVPESVVFDSVLDPVAGGFEVER